MSTTCSSGRAPHMAFCRRLLAALACAFAVPCLAQAPVAMGGTTAPSSPSASETAGSGGTGQAGQGDAPGTKANVSATLEQCATALAQTERSATFAGEMTVIPGTARMEIRIDIEERSPGEAQYRTVSAPGLGVWRGSAPGVKTYTHIQQVTNLSAPASYRGAVRFRWLNARDRLIKAEELRTPACEQPAVPSTTGATGPSGQSTVG
jgi:hypothetical protein